MGVQPLRSEEHTKDDHDRAFSATPRRKPQCSWITAARSMGLIVGAIEGRQDRMKHEVRSAPRAVTEAARSSESSRRCF